MPSLSALLVMLAFAAEPAASGEAPDPAKPQINPVPRAVIEETLAEWTFDRDTEGWVAERHCVLQADGGLLKIEAKGDDPYFHRPVDLPGGMLALRIRARSNAAGPGSVYWTTDQSPGRGKDKAQHFSLRHDGQWHEYVAEFSAPGRLTDLRIDPGAAAGRVDIDWIRLVRREPHPLAIERVQVTGDRAYFTVKNHQAQPCDAEIQGARRTLAGNATVAFEVPLARHGPLEQVSLEILVERFPPLRRTVFVYHPEVKADWIACPSRAAPRPERERQDAASTPDAFALKVARDGSAALILRGGRPAAVLAPLVHCDGRLPALQLVAQTPQLRFEDDGVALGVSAAGNEITVSIHSDTPCEGPVVRVLGGLQQGLLAGVEYLGKGEYSSSMLDIETEEHVRFAPKPLDVTLPLMAFVTDRASVAMTWDDMTLQPVFATPNFFDGTADHRMALRGTKIEAVIRVDQDRLEESIHWAVQRKGLPPLPPAPRDRQQQYDLCVKALNGPLRTEKGWGHCVEDHWARHPHADMASTLFRLTGKAPELPTLVPGGSHVPNGTIYFVTGRARQWLQHQEHQAQSLMAQQKPDGSYRYDGPYRRGHFEDTASGVCARPAALLLEHAWVTGDAGALAAGVRALEYMKRFDTPRGAQVWEIPLHTPDQLASAYAVWAYVRGYELTGKPEYLREARRWALSGVPFVYLWGRYPIMLYGTPPVFGATHWKAPNWIGLPVQWVGGVYAYALTMLAPHEKSLDWNHLARGILIAAEQMQYPDGPYAGLLPDSLHLETQERRPWRINPCALVSLRMALDGEVDFLSVAVEGKHRVAAPFPVNIRNGQAHIRAKAGLTYQVLINGRRIVDVTSQGDDVVPLP